MSVLPEALQPLEWLVGKWICDQASGSFPTIKDFKYGEEIEFVNIGQPMLNYTSRSWHLEKKTPMHLESGFLRIKPGSDQVAFLVSHNFGVTSIEEGQVEGLSLQLVSKDICRISFARDPSVTKIVRKFEKKDDHLVQTLSMETSNTPLTHHLEARYKRV